MRRLLTTVAAAVAVGAILPSPVATAACDEHPEVCKPARDGAREADRADDKARDEAKEVTKGITLDEPPPLPYCNASLGHQQRLSGAALTVWLSFAINAGGDCYPADTVGCYVDAMGANVGGAVDIDDDGDCLASSTTTETVNGGEMYLHGLVASPMAVKSRIKHIVAICFTVYSCDEVVTTVQ